MILTEVRLELVLAFKFLECSARRLVSTGLLFVIVPREMRSLSDQVLGVVLVQVFRPRLKSTYETMKVVENMEICHISPTLLSYSLDLAFFDTILRPFVDGNHNGSV